MFESQSESKINWTAVIVGALIGVAGTFAVKLIAGFITPSAPPASK